MNGLMNGLMILDEILKNSQALPNDPINENKPVNGSHLTRPILMSVSDYWANPEIVVWIFNTFDKNLRTKNDFTKHLEESCL